MSQITIQNFKKIINHTAVKCAVVGIVNMLFSICVIFALKYFANTNDVIANAIGYALGLACSFMLNKRWTFKHTDDSLFTILRFILVFAIAYLANIATVLGLIELNVNAYFAQLAGIPLYSLTFYFGSKYFVFVPISKFKVPDKL